MPANLQIVVDTDVGLDDALALMLCLASEVWGEAKILGITCVHGNTSLNNVCCNTLKVLHATGRLDDTGSCDATPGGGTVFRMKSARVAITAQSVHPLQHIYGRQSTHHVTEVPVYRGAGESLVDSPEQRAELYHGTDGFGDFEYLNTPEPDHYLQSEHAVNFLTKIVSDKPHEISLLCLGPLTNIALAIHMDENFCSNVKEVVIMGGNIAGVGNSTAAAEFNFHCDPEAAHVVLKSMKCPVTIFPWESADLRARISYDWRRDVLGQVQTPQIQLLNEVESKVLATRIKDAWVQCDPVAAAILIRPSIITSKLSRYVMVELHGRHTRGAMVPDHNDVLRKQHNVTIVESIDMNLYKAILLSAAETNLKKGIKCEK